MRVEQGLGHGPLPALFFPEALLDPCGCVPLDFSQEPGGEILQRLHARDRSQVLQVDLLTARFQPALGVDLARPCEAGLQQAVARQRLEALGQLPARALQRPGSRLEASNQRISACPIHWLTPSQRTRNQPAKPTSDCWSVLA